MSGATEALKIAHTARCKLHIEADRPDRNLRFILGHAFTLDKMMLRIAEIEVDSNSSDDDEDLPAFNQGVSVGGKDGGNGQVGDDQNGRRVSFSGKVKKGAGANVGGGMISRRSPPPPSKRAVPGLVDSESESDSDDDDVNGQKNGRDGVDDESTDEEDEEDLPEDDESGGGLGLTRFSSAAGHVRGVGGDSDVKGEDKKTAAKPDAGFMTEEELREVCVGEGDAELKGLYDHVSGCPCHGEKGPEVQKFWEVPSSGIGSEGGGRRVVVQVSA